MNRIPQNDPEFLAFQRRLIARRRAAGFRKAMIITATMVLLAAILALGVFMIYRVGQEPVTDPLKDQNNGLTDGGNHSQSGNQSGNSTEDVSGNDQNDSKGSEDGSLSNGSQIPSGSTDVGGSENTEQDKIIVYIDAGHGFDNSVGTPDVGTGTGTPYHELTGKYESDLNLEIALKLKEILLEKGYAVVMSREAQVSEHVTINERVSRVNSTECDIFISIHANSFDSENVSGARIYYSSLNDNAIKCKRYASVVASALNAMEGVSQREVTVEDHADIGVIKSVKVPTVLVETCFLTSPTDAALAASEEWIEKMATGLCNGIEGYLAQVSA